METAQLNLSFCYITAPFDGRVGLRLVDPGNLVGHATDPGGIVTLTEVHPINVVFTLPQRNLPSIVEAMASRKLDVAAWSSDDKIALAQGMGLYPGQCHRYHDRDDPAESDLPEPGRQTVAGPVRRGAIAAAHRGTGGHRPDACGAARPRRALRLRSTVQRQVIEAQDRGSVMVVTKGLDAGQAIVLDGQSRLENGTHVVAAAGASPTAAQAGG